MASDPSALERCISEISKASPVQGGFLDEAREFTRPKRLNAQQAPSNGKPLLRKDWGFHSGEEYDLIRDALISQEWPYEDGKLDSTSGNEAGPRPPGPHPFIGQGNGSAGYLSKCPGVDTSEGIINWNLERPLR